MELKFDGSQDYQLAAIQAVIDLFEGQPLAQGDFEVSLASEASSLLFSDKGIGNQLVLSPEQLLINVRAVQEKNGIKPLSETLEPCAYALTQENNETVEGVIPLNFTVEMETGTGKTYTYLRTIYALNKVYGFKKFVIVVPSVAIREGAVKNLQITHSHFQDLYDKQPINYVMYDSGNLSALRNFATSNAIQILVINIDSFAKESNIINTVRETGIKPIEYIRSTCPIVIVDEPQNMETEARRAALHNLNPLCLLRYSATHRHLYNLIYNLNPVQAYDLGLVKQIEVDGVSADTNTSAAFVHVKKVLPGKRNLQAKVAIYVNEGGGVRQKDVTLSLGDDLFKKSNGRDVYKNGFILNSINAETGMIEFSGGAVLQEGTAQGGLNDEVLKYQIERTVETHFAKLKRLQSQGIKVLSLFFIDRVANYREYTTDGEPQPGKFAIWFEQAFTSTAKRYPGLLPFAASEVHNGYFSSDKKTTGKDKKDLWIDSKEKNTKADESTYSLIMREKERLLSQDEPLQFIFSHSALREGWDNPNVFQICTLNETKSELKKRQEIGRGLRLPVDSAGRRVSDKAISVLTVIANESCHDFSVALQREIQDETSVDFTGRIKNVRDKGQVKLSRELTLENFPKLFEIWEKISHRTRYAVDYSAEELIDRTVAELLNFNTVPLTRRPMLEARTARLSYSQAGIETALNNIGEKTIEAVRYSLPDVYGYIQSRVDVSRNTVYEILKQSGRYDELEINPQLFLDNVIGAIRRTLNSLLVEGVKYERINGSTYEMSLFKLEEIETYLSNLLPVDAEKQDKTPFNYYAVDSDIERKFARDCEADEKIKFFFKLPRGFKVPTPIGNYVPDWAVVLENNRCVYFVAETKGFLDKQRLRVLEGMKIACGEKHFALFKPSGVDYKLAVTTRDL